MRHLARTRIVAAGAAGFAAWVSVGSLAIADRDAFSRIGFLPPLWLIPVFVAGAVLTARAVRLPNSASLPLFFSLVLLLPWLPITPPPAFLIWSGPMEIVVWIAVVVGIFTSLPRTTPQPLRRSAPLMAAAVAFLTYIAGAWSLAGAMPAGDEPHYLVITQSILSDGDIRVENNYDQQQYVAYWPGPLRPHSGQRGVDGHMYSAHAPGLPAVVAPAFALGGYTSVVIFLSMIAAGASGLLWQQAHAITGSVSAAWFAWAAGALNATFFFQAFSVYPDALGGALVLCAAVPLFGRDQSALRWGATGAALALLPWLHTRFAVISGILGLVLLLRLVRSAKSSARIPAFLLAPVVSAALWFGFFRAVYGSFDPSSPYGGDTHTSVTHILHGLPALWLDQQFGILPNAPVLVFGVIGMVTLAFSQKRLALELCAVGVGYLVAVSSFDMWWAGSSAPARFLAPLVPVFSVPIALFWSSTSSRTARGVALAALTVSVLTTATMAAVDGGRLAYNGEDGYARAAEWVSPLTDLPLALPSFFRQTSGEAVLLSVVWFGFFLIAVSALRAIERRTDVRGAVGLATPVCLSLAIMAAATTVWGLDSAPAVNAENSLRVLSGYNASVRPVGVDLESRRIVPADSLLPRLVISTADRRGAASQGTLLLVPMPVPAGEYDVSPDEDARAHGAARLVIGRLARPLKSWAVGHGRDATTAIRLPVTVGSLAVLGDQETAAGTLRLVPRKIFRGPSILTSDIARRAEQYGPAQVFFFAGYDSQVFLEGSGFWVKAGRSVQLAATREDLSAPLHMFLRNGATKNEVRLTIDDNVRTLVVQPREELTIPVPIVGSRPGTLMKIEPLSGFRPADTEPGSKDERFLGVWIEFR